MSNQIPPKPVGSNWVNWAQRLSAYLAQTRSLLRHKVEGESAQNDGILLWDDSEYEPVVSVGGEYVPIVLEGGFGAFVDTTDQSPAVINTAYAITFNTTSQSDKVTLGTPTSRIVFEDKGLYEVSFSVQLTSSSSSAKDVWFWPRVNGVDVANTAMKITVSENSATIALSRTAFFSFNANDYLEAMWASDSTDVSIHAVAATSFAPATPSVILSATRIHR